MIATDCNEGMTYYNSQANTLSTAATYRPEVCAVNFAGAISRGTPPNRYPYCGRTWYSWRPCPT